MDSFNLAQLTKHLVLKNAKGAPDPYAEARAAVRVTLQTYLKGMAAGNPEVKQGVKEVARGAMTGLLLADVLLAPGAVAVLQAVGELAPHLPHDPTELMTSSIEGIAELRLLLSVDGLALIQAALERECMGSGEVFRRCLELKGTRDEQIARRVP